MKRLFFSFGKEVKRAYNRFAGVGSGSFGSGSFGSGIAYVWVPLITSDAFTGINTDVLTTAAGIISIMVVVVGIGILIRVFTH